MFTYSELCLDRAASGRAAVTLSDVRYYNSLAGYHFFDRSTMRFFSSKIESSLYAGGYFITSESVGFSGAGRAFTVRRVNDDWSIGDLGGFLQHRTIDSARAAIREAQRLSKS